MVTIAGPDHHRSYITLTAEGSIESLLDLDVPEIERLYKQHGAILFRGFPFDINVFRTLTQRFCTHSAFNNSKMRVVVDQENHIQSVNLGVAPIILHPELSREPYKPDVCWFACISPSRAGGETVICDGVELVKRMPAEVFQSLNGRRLLYRRKATRKEILFWLKTNQPTVANMENPPDDCPYRFFRQGGQIMCGFSAPALHRPMFTDGLAFGSFLLLARYALNSKSYPLFEDGSEIPDSLVAAILEIGDQLKQSLKWQANDVLMLDNTRYMHGRNEIGDPNNRRIISYFGYLNFAVPGPEEGANARWRKTGGLDGLFLQ